jgi:hypothetical protein
LQWHKRARATSSATAASKQHIGTEQPVNAKRLMHLTCKIQQSKPPININKHQDIIGPLTAHLHGLQQLGHLSPLKRAANNR